MSSGPRRLIRHVRQLARQIGCDPATDAELLERFLRQRDEAAFAALVDRHGAMVLRLCRRQLAEREEIENAFQATFLVLARKAATIRYRERLAAWLYGVARRVVRAAQRRQRQRPAHAWTGDVTTVADRRPGPLDTLTARELLEIIDAEVARLPEKYRLPVILCGLEGIGQEEAARRLG